MILSALLTKIQTTIDPFPKKFTNNEKQKVNATYNISRTLQELNRNFVFVFNDIYAQVKTSLKEARNDIKLIVSSVNFIIPEKYKTIKINEESRKQIVNILLRRKEYIKIKRVPGPYASFINQNIDKTFTKQKLSALVIEDLYQTFVNIINATIEDTSKFILDVTKREERSTRNIKTAIAEVLSTAIFPGIPVYKSGTKINDNYIEEHPNGSNRFPDFVLHINKNTQKINQLRKDFSLPSNVKKIYIESKATSRIVGKQSTPSSFKKGLNDDALYKKIQKIREGTSFSGSEIKKIMKASGIELTTPIIYINVKTKNAKGRVKYLSANIKDSDKFIAKRTSKGQIGFYRDGKKFFGLEIGSLAYGKKGEFEI